MYILTLFAIHLLYFRPQARISEKETPRLWCLLGDATDDLQCYEKALELSKDRSARAFRSIGFHHYSRKDWKTCIPFFEKSLACSSMQVSMYRHHAEGYSC